MEIRRRVLEASSGLLPPTYEQKEYILAPGDQAVVDTGVPGDNDNLLFDFAYSVDRLVNYRGLFTNYASETANSWRFSLGTSSGAYLFTANSRTGSSAYINFPDSIGKKTHVILDKTGITMEVDGVSRTLAAPTTSGTTNNASIVINSSRRVSRTNNDVTHWYSFKIYDSGVLIRNYVPCVQKYSGKVGFYETVQHAFCPSTGTKDFCLD